MNNNQPTAAEVARQLEEARSEIERVTKLENINRNVAAQSLAKVQELKAEIERLRAEVVTLQAKLELRDKAQGALAHYIVRATSGRRKLEKELERLREQAPGEKGGEG